MSWFGGRGEEEGGKEAGMRRGDVGRRRVEKVGRRGVEKEGRKDE